VGLLDAAASFRGRGLGVPATTGQVAWLATPIVLVICAAPSAAQDGIEMRVYAMAGDQRSRSNSSCDTPSCRRILKNSGGPISRLPCRGMVTDRPSLCVQRSWLPVLTTLHEAERHRRPLKLARSRR
jgi:hypothetical protein